jgi:hypothetical protein
MQLLIVAILLFTSAAFSQAEHISNPSTPTNGIQVIELQEQWTIGGSDDDAHLFGVISQVLADSDGNIYLLDSQLSQVHVFSTDGEFIHHLSREGEGPGETRSPNDMMFMPDGSLGLMQVFPGSIVQIDLEGSPVGKYPFDAGNPNAGGFAVLVRGKSKAGSLVLVGMRQTFNAGQLIQNRFVSNFNSEGEELVVYLSGTMEQNFANLVLDEVATDFPWARWDIATNGSIVIAPSRDEYRFERYTSAGELELTFGRDFEPLKRDDDAMKQIISSMEAQGRHYPVPPKVTVSDFEPTTHWVHSDSHGNTWVQTSRSGIDQPEGIMLSYDIFNNDGEFINQYAFACDGDTKHDLMFFIDDNRCLLVKGFHDSLASMQGVSTTEDEEEPEPVSVTNFTIEWK